MAWDSRGNAYMSCQLFNRGTVASPNPDESSAFVIYRSTQNDGASWNFPGRYTTVFNDTAGSGAVLEDKALMTVDNNARSPFRDRIYVTWTEFAADGSAYIYEVHSDDYGETFSDRTVVSKDSAVCTNTFGAGTPNGHCNENQFSDPFVGPDGNLYVAYDNFNNQPADSTDTDNHYQVLLSKSTDGGQTFSAPVKVSNYYDLPNCDTYQGDGADPGRSCVPEKGSSTISVFRATNYPSGQVDPTNARRVTVAFGSYINKYSNERNGCTPTGFADDGNPTYTGVKTPGACNNKILLGVSEQRWVVVRQLDRSTRIRSAYSKTSSPTNAVKSELTSSGSGARLRARASSPSTTTTASTATMRPTARRTSACPGARTCRTSARSASRRARCRRRPSSRARTAASSTATTSDSPRSTRHTRSGRTRARPTCSSVRAPPRLSKPPTLCGATEHNGQTANDEESFTATVSVPSSGGHGH